MAEERVPSFARFWPYYVGEHRHPVCRALHFVGTNSGITVLVSGIALGKPLLLPLAFVCGYGLAWVGHFFVEHNRPATFKYPLWSFAADFKMLGLMFAGKMGDEVTRLYGSSAPARTAPLLAQT